MSFDALDLFQEKQALANYIYVLTKKFIHLPQMYFYFSEKLNVLKIYSAKLKKIKRHELNTAGKKK